MLQREKGLFQYKRKIKINFKSLPHNIQAYTYPSLINVCFFV